MQSILYTKMEDIDLYNYDNPEFYNNYFWVLQDAEARCFTILNNIVEFYCNLLNIVIIGSLVIFYEPILLLLIIFTTGLSILINKFKGREIFKIKNDGIRYERELAYVKRAYYLKDYAIDIKISNIKEVMKKKLIDITYMMKSILNKHILKILF